MVFRLSQNPALGIFIFTSGSWSLVEDALSAVEALRSYRGPGLVRLSLHRASLTLASGQVMSCTTPRLTVLVTGPREPIRLV